MFCGGFGPFGYGSYGYGPSGFGGGIFPLIMMAFQVLIFVAIAVFAVKLFRKFTSGSIGALKTLDEKFARGEISEEEYIKRRTILSQRS